MKKSKWINIPATFLPTSAVTLTLLLGSARTGLAQARVQFWSGQATISTSYCNSPNTTPPGLCQPAPACNNGAGPNPDNIQASVTLCEVSVQVQSIQDNATWVGSGTLTGSGAGTGFRPGATYISILSFDNNTANCGSGSDLLGASSTVTIRGFVSGSVVLGIWKVNPDGTATLTVDAPATVLGLNKYGTVSVREMQRPKPDCFNCTNDPVQQLIALRACGPLTVTPTTSCTLP